MYIVQHIRCIARRLCLVDLMAGPATVLAQNIDSSLVPSPGPDMMNGSRGLEKVLSEICVLRAEGALFCWDSRPQDVR